MTGWLISLLAGMGAGILSAFGIGGGSLLLVYMTAIAGLPQQEARGINLLYFLPAAAASLPAHFRHRRVETSALLPAISAGLVSAAFASWMGAGMDTELLRRCFGGFLLVVGVRELCRK